jgi:hypothetical protein
MFRHLQKRWVQVTVQTNMECKVISEPTTTKLNRGRSLRFKLQPEVANQERMLNSRKNLDVSVYDITFCLAYLSNEPGLAFIHEIIFENGTQYKGQVK